MIYRKNSACRRASGNFLLSSLRCRYTTRYNWLQSILLEAEGVADSQFNFMAYTVPPSAAAYRTPSSVFLFLFFFYIILRRPSSLVFQHPLKTFLLGILETFKSLPRFPSSFLKIHPPPTRTHLPCPLRRIARWIGHWGMATWLVNA